MNFTLLLGNDKIEAIQQSFEDSILGTGFSLAYDVKIEPKDIDASYISFTEKNPSPVSEITIGEIFQFGIMLGRDYLQDPDYYKWKESMKNLKELYDRDYLQDPYEKKE